MQEADKYFQDALRLIFIRLGTLQQDVRQMLQHPNDCGGLCLLCKEDTHGL